MLGRCAFYFMLPLPTQPAPPFEPRSRSLTPLLLHPLSDPLLRNHGGKLSGSATTPRLKRARWRMKKPPVPFSDFTAMARTRTKTSATVRTPIYRCFRRCCWFFNKTKNAKKKPKELSWLSWRSLQSWCSKDVRSITPCRKPPKRRRAHRRCQEGKNGRDT